MTLIITAAAALVVTALRFIWPELGSKLHLGALALMYVGASLMWSVDELSDSAAMADDALLGLCVLVLGLAAWAVVITVNKMRAGKPAAS